MTMIRMHYSDGFPRLVIVACLVATFGWTANADEPTLIHSESGGFITLEGESRVRVSGLKGTVAVRTGKEGELRYEVRSLDKRREERPIGLWLDGNAFEIAPLEGTVDGTLVLGRGDQIFHLGRYVDDEVRIQFELGRATSIEGGLDAVLLESHLASYRDPSAFLAGHVAWGTDHRASWTAPLVQFPDAGAGNADTEGFLGSVQVELGRNDDQFFRGAIRSDAHLGLCLLGASISLDGERVIEAGRFTGSLQSCQPEA